MIKKTLNFLQNIEFRISIKRLPNTSFFLQKMSMPDVSMTPTIQPTPRTQIKRNADQMNFSDLNLTFICDEAMDSYIELFNWMIGLTPPEDDETYSELNKSEDTLYSDISIFIHGNDNKPIAEIIFYKCFPVNISGLELDVTVSDFTPTTITVIFAFDTFEIKTGHL